jgi:hypothetical protein
MKRLQFNSLLVCLVLLLVFTQAFALTKNDETSGVSFLKSSFSDALSSADKPIMIDFWSDG